MLSEVKASAAFTEVEAPLQVKLQMIGFPRAKDALRMTKLKGTRRAPNSRTPLTTQAFPDFSVQFQFPYGQPASAGKSSRNYLETE